MNKDKQAGKGNKASDNINNLWLIIKERLVVK